MAGQEDPEEGIFETLRRRNDTQAQQAKARLVERKEQKLHEKEQKRLVNLITENGTLPCIVSGIEVSGALHTRSSLLRRIFAPVVNTNRNGPSELGEVISQAMLALAKLDKHDIFHAPSRLTVYRPDQSDPSSTPIDLKLGVSVKEKSRLFFKTGTEVGNAEGSAFGNAVWRNAFGGAETLNLNAALGTRTRSAYQASFQTPFLANPDFLGEIGALVSSTQKPWASHEEALTGGWANLRWLARGGRHELAYNGVWRQLTGLAPNASPTVRGDAGDSVKSSLKYSLTNDRRDVPLLPQRGYYTKSSLEIAGLGPLQGDVGFGKAEIEAQTVVPIPTFGSKASSGVSFTTGLRAGLLCPLPVGIDTKLAPSRLNDRFQLGGPTDVRGFRIGGLGPRDGTDAVGGDIYAAGSANLLLPLPRVGPDKPIRFQAFVNGGRLLALNTSSREEKGGKIDADWVRRSVKDTVSELGNGWPSMAAGVGLVYAHPIVRFELNFSLPLVIRRGEDARKGLQFG
ncbi:MAG: hypothetical protein Q9190_005276, partial [Brigantiaea leucoxantha]